jgi:hypothetical protein
MIVPARAASLRWMTLPWPAGEGKTHFHVPRGGLGDLAGRVLLYQLVGLSRGGVGCPLVHAVAVGQRLALWLPADGELTRAQAVLLATITLGVAYGRVRCAAGSLRCNAVMRIAPRAAHRACVRSALCAHPWQTGPESPVACCARTMLAAAVRSRSLRRRISRPLSHLEVDDIEAAHPRFRRCA